MAGTEIDQSFDSSFNKLIEQVNSLESNLKKHIQYERQAQNSLMLLLMLAVCLMASLSAFMIWRFTLNRANYLSQLSAANQRISEQNNQLKKLAHTDQLTGLPNRQMLETIATQILGQVHRGKTCMSVTFIDLDFFKPINDQFGHSVGDKVLTSLTKAISLELRDEDVLARLAGDEFILLLQGDDEEGIKQALDNIFKRIEQRLKIPIINHPQEIHIRISAGSAFAPSHAKDLETLIHLADMAMYQSKQQGRGHHRYFLPASDAVLQDHSINQQLTPEAATE